MNEESGEKWERRDCGLVIEPAEFLGINDNCWAAGVVALGLFVAGKGEKGGLQSTRSIHEFTVGDRGFGVGECQLIADGVPARR